MTHKRRKTMDDLSIFSFGLPAQSQQQQQLTTPVSPMTPSYSYSDSNSFNRQFHGQQSPLKRSYSINSAEIFVNQFQNLDSYEQNKALLQLSSSICSQRQLSLLANYILPKLKFDIVGNLPFELAQHVLSFLTVKSIVRLSQCSTSHKRLIQDPQLWRDLCQRYRYSISSFAGQQLQRSVLGSTVSMSPISIQSDDEFASCNDSNLMDIDERIHKNILQSQLQFYKEQFIQNYVIDQCWRTNYCNEISIDGPQHSIITCLQFDSKHLVIGTDSQMYGIIDVYEKSTGQRLQRLCGHEGGVWALDFLDDILVSGGCDRDFRIWSIKTGQCVSRISGHTSTIRCMKLIDKDTCVTGSRDSTLRIWNITKGSCEKVLRGHTQSIRCLAVQGNKIVSGSYDKTLRIWDLQSGETLNILNLHTAQIYSVVFKNNFICSGSLDTKIMVWDAETGQCLNQLNGHSALVGHMQLENDMLFSGGSDGKVFIWNVKTGQRIHKIKAHQNSVTSLQFYKNRLVTGGDDGIKLWDVQSGKLIRHMLTEVTGIWRLQIDNTTLIAAAQNDEDTMIEIMDFGISKHLKFTNA